jgi:transposase
MSLQDDQLREAMRQYAAGLAETHTAPEASLIWFRAERRRRRMAIERAERPLRIMQVVGMLCALFAAGWLLVRSVSTSAATNAGTNALGGIATPWLVLTIGGAFVTIAGCWMMMLASRKPLS